MDKKEKKAPKKTAKKAEPKEKKTPKKAEPKEKKTPKKAEPKEKKTPKKTGKQAETKEPSINEDIAEHLRQLAKDERELNNNVHRFISYNKAAKALVEHETRIKSGAEGKKLKGIGPSVALLIDEFLAGGGESSTPAKASSSKEEEALESPQVQSAKEPLGMQSLILDHYDKLCMSKLEAMQLNCAQQYTIADLLNIADTLPANQQECVRHFEDLCKPITREEIEKIAKQLKKSIKQISQHLTLTICGAYRRGATESDRIDLLLVHSDITSTQKDAAGLLEKALVQVVEALEEETIIRERFTLDQEHFDGLIQRQTSAPYRRCTLYIAPKDQEVCMLFSLTGNENFYEQTVQYALSKGYILEKQALRRIGQTSVPGQPIPLEDESELFEFIEHDFVKPEERII